jgi:hypothetical protein
MIAITVDKRYLTSLSGILVEVVKDLTKCAFKYWSGYCVIGGPVIEVGQEERRKRCARAKIGDESASGPIIISSTHRGSDE